MKDIIAKAIEKEIEARDIYLRAAGMAATPEVKDLFLWLAGEEKIHENKLRDLETGQLAGAGDIKDTPSLVDFLQDPPPAALDNMQNILIFAMKRERKAYLFYRDMTESVNDPSARDVLTWLAGEEKTHLEKIEKIYDEKIQPEN